MSNLCNNLSPKLQEHKERYDKNGKLIASFKAINETWDRSR